MVYFVVLNYMHACVSLGVRMDVYVSASGVEGRGSGPPQCWSCESVDVGAGNQT